MPQFYRYLVHERGPALWAEHKPLSEVLELQATTPPVIWEATYQGNPTPPEGTIFIRSWWGNKNRFDASDPSFANKTIARWISWDTGIKDKEDSAFTAAVVGELQPDYTLLTREVFRERLTFPDLPSVIERLAARYNKDGKLRGIIIEDKASGTSAYQTLLKTADPVLASLLVAFLPTVDKEARAQQAAVWCKQNCVFLPLPSDRVPWLYDFEDELFNFPGTSYKDQVDAFSQLILWTENLLAAGFHARGGS